MLPVLGIVVKLAIYAGVAFILSKTLPSMPNKVCRFVFLFVLCVPLNFVINGLNVRLLGYHKMGWTEASIIALLIALLFAAIGTSLWSPQPHNSNAP